MLLGRTLSQPPQHFKHLVAAVVVIVFIKSCQKATYTQINNSFIQRTCSKIITEEPITFISKLSILAPALSGSSEGKTWLKLVKIA